MLAYIKGKCLSVFKDSAILEANGLGYKVFLKTDTLAKLSLDNTHALFLSHIVKEDKSDLYGFETQDEVDFFELLLSVSGVGPKSALAIMSLDSLENLKQAIFESNSAYLSQVSGVGKKTAQKLVLELQDKMQYTSGESQLSAELTEVLQSMGYKLQEIRSAIKTIDKSKDLQAQIKDALQQLSKI